MFESYQEAERNRGFKGFIARHFGPVIYADAAEEGIRQVGVVFMALAALTAVVGMAISGQIWPLIAGLILIAFALALYWTKSRASAVILLAITLANAVLSLAALLPWVWVLFSVRAIQLTFGYHRLRKMRSEVLSTLE